MAAEPSYQFQDYWTLVSAYRRGDHGAMVGLELMATGFGAAAKRAADFVASEKTREGHGKNAAS